MTKFKYKARDQDGNLVNGVKEAASPEEVARALTNENLLAVEIIEEKGKKEKKAKKPAFAFSSGVKDKEVAIFCRQFSTMISAGVSVAEALEDMSKSVENPRFRQVLGKILNEVRGGSSLAEAFSRQSSVFSTIFVHMISAGEESGKLGTVLKDLSHYLEKKVKLRGQLRSASMYPIFVGSFFAVIILGLVLFLIPTFAELFESLGADLPGPTQITMNISNMMVRNLPGLFILLVLSVIGFITAYKSKPGRYIIDSAIIKLPLFGPVLLKVILARYFQTLATLLKSGLDVVASLDIAAKVASNAKIERIVDKIKMDIVEGSSLSAGMGKCAIFPRLTVSMTSVGEKSGTIDEMLVKISDYYTDEVDSDVEGFSTLIEPVMIVSLGLIVGLFVITMYLPIFQMAGAMMGGM